jgi:FKBP-type peptidyl-prolyl cis-trans isomerase FklB
MKIRLSAVLAVGLFFSAVSLYAAEGVTLTTPKEKLSYIIGVQIGNDMKNQSLDVDPGLISKGLNDSMQGKDLLIKDQEAKDIIAAFQKERAGKMAEQKKMIGEKNKTDGAAFLAENKKKEGVKVLPSGLQYKVIKEGAGKTPKATDTVVTQYKGTTIDGKEFDSSYKRGEPATFPVNGVIRGWTEALQLMKEGSTWQLVVPPDLAYGEQGAGNMIGPNATLIFEVELVSVK